MSQKRNYIIKIRGNDWADTEKHKPDLLWLCAINENEINKKDLRLEQLVQEK